MREKKGPATLLDKLEIEEALDKLWRQLEIAEVPAVWILDPAVKLWPYKQHPGQRWTIPT